jgi:hypothetical protein
MAAAGIATFAFCAAAGELVDLDAARRGAGRRGNQQHGCHRQNKRSIAAPPRMNPS